MADSLTARRTKRSALLAVLLLLSIPAVGLTLVVLADLVPDRLIVKELVNGLEDGSLPRENYGSGWTGHQVDQWTDCAGLTTFLGDSPGTGALTSAIEGPTLGECTAAVPALESYLAGAALTRQQEYYRYWHGFAVPIRALVATVGVRGARILTGLILIVALAGLTRTLSRRHGWLAPSVLLAPFVLTTDFGDLPQSLPHAYGVIAALLSCWLAHALVARRCTISRAAVTSLLSGAVVVFADPLASAPAAWALCVFVVTLATSTRTTGIRLALVTGVSTASWILGYAWTWFTKWVLAAFVYGIDQVRAMVSGSMSARLDSRFVGFEDAFFASSRLNAEEWWEQPLSGVMIVALITTFVVVWGRRISAGNARDGRTLDRLVLLLPALIPIVWYELLRNHSQIHTWFTYRAVSIIIGIIAAASMVGLVGKKTPGPPIDSLPSEPPPLRQSSFEEGIHVTPTATAVSGTIAAANM